MVAGRMRRMTAERVAMRKFLYATDGRDIMANTPDGWEVGAPMVWWDGPAGGDGSGGPWGNPPPGADVNPWVYGAAAMPAVTRCTNLIASTIAGLPWRVQRDTEQLPVPPWIDDPQLLRPDGRLGRTALLQPARLSAVEFRTQWITSALWFGDGYIYAPVRDANGAPIPPLWLISPQRVRIDAGGNYYLPETGSLLDYSGDVLPRVDFDPNELIHLRGNPPYLNGHGQGVITSAGPEMGLAATVRNYAYGQFKAGVPAGFLKVNAPNLTQEQSDALKQKWMAAHGSSRRSIAVLNATTDFTPIGISPLDAQLSDAREWSLRDTAMAFGVPQWFLGVASKDDTYTNVESRFIELRTYSLLPWIRRIEACLDAEFPMGTDLRVSTAGLERGDTTTRYANYTAGLSGGWLTIPEIREAEGLPPLDESELPEQAPADPAPAPVTTLTVVPTSPDATTDDPTVEGDAAQ